MVRAPEAMALRLLTPPLVPRRIAALFGIVVLLGLVLLLMWRVYRQHESMHEPDDYAISTVSLDATSLRSVEKFALEID